LTIRSPAVFSALPNLGTARFEGGVMVFVGDDWAEDHHDVEIVDENWNVLARQRLPEGLEGVTRLHALIAEHASPQWEQMDPVEPRLW